MRQAKAAFRAAFWSDERGATAIEYALIGGFASVVIVAGVDLVGIGVSDLFQKVVDGFAFVN